MNSYDYYEISNILAKGGFVFCLIVIVLSFTSMWFLFEKAGIAGWKALVPLYNSYLLYKIAWGSGWYCLLLLIPYVGFGISIVCACKLSRAFGKGFGMSMLLILLPFVGYLALSFGNAKYRGCDSMNNKGSFY